MTLLQLIRTFEAVALKQPAVKTVVENDVFRLNSLPNVRYGVFAWLQGNHSGAVDSDLRTFSFTFFYVDRLRTDGRNETEVQSVGIDTIQNILRVLSEEYDLDIEEWNATCFNQRFKDECAGVFVNVQISAPVDSTCDEANLGDFSADFSDDFWVNVM